MKSIEHRPKTQQEDKSTIEPASVSFILNPAFLVLPETDYAISHGLVRRKLEKGLPVIYKSDAGWHNPALFPVLVQYADGTTAVAYTTINDLCDTAPASSVQKIGASEKTFPVGKDNPTGTTKKAIDVVIADVQAMPVEAQYSRELTPKDIRHCVTVLKGIAGYTVSERTDKPSLPIGYKLMESVFEPELTKKLTAILKLKLRTNGNESDLLTSIKSLNTHADFFTALTQLLATESVQNVFRVNNCDTSHMPVLNPETPDWILKVWYFLVNHPKHTTYHDGGKSFFDKILYERWRRLVKLEPQTLVTLFFSAVGVTPVLIDKLLNQPLGSSEVTVAKYFQQETALNISKDWKITHIAGLSYTFAQICEFSPFAYKIDTLQKQEEKLVTISNVSPAKLLILTQFFHHALKAVAENNSPIGKTASFNNLVRKFFAGKISIGYLQDLLQDVWQIRPGFSDTELLCAPDIIWVARGIELTKNSEAKL